MRYGVADFSWRGPCHQKLQIFGFGLYFQGFQVVAHKSMAQQLLQAHGAASQGPLRTVTRNPWKQSPQEILSSGQHGPLQPKSGEPHLIAIQNMRSE